MVFSKCTTSPFITSTIAGICLFSLSACVTNNRDTIQQNANYVETFPGVNIEEIALNASKDVFKIGDTADITVYNVENLSGVYVVDRAGNIDFPLIGSIKVAGLSTVDLQQTLAQRYGSEYLRTPNINVKLEGQDLGRIVVDGAVNKPGVFEIDRIIRLSEAIARAEGLDEDANGSSVYIIRSVEGESKVREVNLKEIRNLGAQDPEIIPEDVIFVQDSVGRVAFREFLRTVPLLNTAIIYGLRR